MGCIFLIDEVLVLCAICGQCLSSISIITFIYFENALEMTVLGEKMNTSISWRKDEYSVD